MSDWTGTYSTAESIQAGMDLEMPCVSPYLSAEGSTLMVYAVDLLSCAVML